MWKISIYAMTKAPRDCHPPPDLYSQETNPSREEYESMDIRSDTLAIRLDREEKIVDQRIPYY
jgi:hypothetical protein